MAASFATLQARKILKFTNGIEELGESQPSSFGVLPDPQGLDYFRVLNTWLRGNVALWPSWPQIKFSRGNVAKIKFSGGHRRKLLFLNLFHINIHMFLILVDSLRVFRGVIRDIRGFLGLGYMVFFCSGVAATRAQLELRGILFAATTATRPRI